MATDHNFKVKKGLTVTNNETDFRGIDVLGTNPAIYFKDDVGSNAWHIGHNDAILYVLQDSNRSGAYNNIAAYWDTNNNYVVDNGYIRSDDGYYIGTTRILDSSRNLSNIGTGAFSGNVTIDTSGGGAVVGKTSGSNEWFVGGMTAGLGSGDGLLLYTYDSGSNIKFYVAQSHKFTMTNAGAFQVGNTTVIDSSRNLTNIGTISSGNITSSGTISSSHITSSGRGTFVGNAATPAGLNALNLLSSSNGGGVAITFTDNGSPPAANTGQRATLQYFHSDSASYGSGNAFIFDSTESSLTVLANGKLMFKEGLYVKPSSGTGAGTQIIDSSRNLTSIGTISNTGRIASSIGSNATYSRPLLEITNGSTPTQIKITTNIPFSGTTHAHAVKISGFQYGSRNTVDLQIAWHVYNNSFYNRIATSSGSWTPTIRLAVENNKVVIHLASPGYWPKLYVESLYNAFGGNTHGNSWSWADAAISADSGTPNETVPYKAAFGNSLSMDMDGNWLVDSGYVRSSDGYKISTTTVIDSNRNLTNIGTITTSGGINLADGQDVTIGTSDTANGKINLGRGGYITFYGDNNSHHSIGSRDNAGNIADDLTISSYGAVYIDLDSNNNNASAADFKIASHGSTTPLYTMSGETGDITTTGTIQNGSVWINDGTNYNNYNENIRLFNPANNVSVIAFSATGTGGVPTTSILGYSDRFETRLGSTWRSRLYSSGLYVNGGYYVNTTAVIDSSRNLVNIGTINTGQGATEVHLMNQNVRTTDSPTFADLTITGNLSITGDINSYNVTDLDVTDKTITLGAGQTEANSGGSGIIIDGSGASLLWDEADNYWAMNKKLAFDTTPTTSNQALGIRWTAFDKEGTSDFSDVAEIIHTTNTGGHAGSVLLIKSQNDSGDGIAFSTHGSSYLKHNSSEILTVNNFNTLMSSSLNAGTLDSLDSSQFLRSDAADTATGQLFFDAGFDAHPIMLSGSQNFDNIDRSGFYNLYNTHSGSTNSPGFPYGTMIAIGNDKGSQGFGLQIAHERTGTGMYVRGMNDTASAWSAWAEIWTSTTDGSGSGLDADKLDGVQGSSFLRSDANDTATGVITFAATPTLGGTSSNEGGEIQFGAPTGGGSAFALDNYQGHFRVHTLQSGKNFQVIGAGESHRTVINTNIGTVWGSNNDGGGSGLDADMVDGIHAGSFLRSDANDTYTGTLSLAGNIQDSGDSRRIHLMYGTTNSQPAIGVGEQGKYGMKMRWDSGTRIEFDGFWNTSVTGARNRDLGSVDVNNANWEFPSGVTINGSTAWHAGNDGSGSGLDADTLDGRDTSDSGGASKVMITNSSGNTSLGSGRLVTGGLYGTGHSSSILPIWQYNSTYTGYGIGYYEGNPDTFRVDVSGNLMSGTPDFEVSTDVARVNGNTVFHTGNDGAGSGLDADTVDGFQGSQFLRKDTSDTMSGALTVTGNVQHTGLTMTSGTDIDQLYSATKSITLSTSWQDTGIIFNNLATGSYIIQVKADDHSVGGQQYSEFYTGVMSWYASSTNSTVTDEILLHRAGHAPNAGDLFLRTARVSGNTSPNLHLEIRGSTSNTGASNYVFKFRRLI